MTARTPTIEDPADVAARDAARSAIKRASKRVARAQEALEAALVDRRRAFHQGRDAGLGLRPMGAIAGISPEAVAKAMRAGS